MSVPNVWAPDVNLLDDGSFLMYFSAVIKTNYTIHCIGAATSGSILGPYTPQPEPLFCPVDQGGAIDAAGLKDWAEKADGWGTGNAGADDDGWREWNSGRRGWSSKSGWGPNSRWSGGGRGGNRYVVYKIDGASKSFLSTMRGGIDWR